MFHGYKQPFHTLGQLKCRDGSEEVRDTVHWAGKSTELLTKAQTFRVTQTRLGSTSCPLVPLPRAAVTIVPKEDRKAVWGAALPACLPLSFPWDPLPSPPCTLAAPNPGANQWKAPPVNVPFWERCLPGPRPPAPGLPMEPGSDPRTAETRHQWLQVQLALEVLKAPQAAAGLAGGSFWRHTQEETDAGSRAPFGGHS